MSQSPQMRTRVGREPEVPVSRRTVQFVLSASVFLIMVAVGIVLGSTLAFAPQLGQRTVAAPVVPAETALIPADDQHNYQVEAVSAPGVEQQSEYAINPEAALPPQQPMRPRIAIVIDDVGMDRRALDKLLALPGPITLSFLPYAPGVQAQADRAHAAGLGVMLHLPMEPHAQAGLKLDPGPNALMTSDNPSRLARKLAENLDAFTGYRGINNHMGSRFTADRPAMQLVFQELRERDLFFLDSVTGGSTVAAHAGEKIDLTILERDVFLDADHGDKSGRQVHVQLAELEALAREQGQAIAIGHPYPATLEALGPWLVTAKMRGFELVLVEDLIQLEAPPPALSALR